jgi:hypothetical protein
MLLKSGLLRVARRGFRSDVRRGDNVRYSPAFYRNGFDEWIVERRSARFLWLRQVTGLRAAPGYRQYSASIWA